MSNVKVEWLPANIAAKVTLLISIGKKPVSSFATKGRLIYYSLLDR